MFINAISNASLVQRSIRTVKTLDHKKNDENNNILLDPINLIQYSILNSNNSLPGRTESNRSIHLYDHLYDDQQGNESYDEPLHRFHEIFLDYYGYASVVVCTFGVITNVINISVLMAKEMRTPTNQFLIALAVFDILTMLPYIPFVLHFNCPPLDPLSKPEAFSYSWVFFLLVVTKLMGTTHVVSMWMAVSLAAFRYSQIRRPCHRGPLAKERRIRCVRVIILAVTVVSTLVLIPNYLTEDIEPLPHQFIANVSLYRIRDNLMGTAFVHPFVLANYLIYGILGKIVPCILIFFFSGHLIYHMSVKNIRRRQRLSAMVQQWKTTHMLLVVLVLFICTELPQGILIVISAFVHGFFNNTHYYIADLLDFASLLNNAINFVLYCAMSQQFRDHFVAMYVNKCWRVQPTLPAKSCHSEVLTMREGNPRTTTTTTHIHEDQKTAKL